MFPQDRKYFRFPFQFVAAVVLTTLLVYPTHAVSVPKGCADAAGYAKNRMTVSITIDTKLLRNIIDCVKELPRLYKTTDWKAIQKMIPQEVKDVVRELPNLGKKALDSAKGSEGLCFVSVYLLYQAVDLYDRAVSLDMDYKMHQKEFEWLESELQSVIDVIHNELLPKWEQLSTAALRKVTVKVFEKLTHCHAELKQLIRGIHNDIKKGLSGGIWAAAYAWGSHVVYVSSVLDGNIPGAIVAGVAGVTSVSSYEFFTVTIKELERLQKDVEMMCIETHEYRFLLERLFIHRIDETPLSSFDLRIFLSFILLLVSICVTKLLVITCAYNSTKKHCLSSPHLSFRICFRI